MVVFLSSACCFCRAGKWQRKEKKGGVVVLGGSQVLNSLGKSVGDGVENSSS